MKNFNKIKNTSSKNPITSDNTDGKVLSITSKENESLQNKKIFIAHGHDTSLRTEVAQFIEQLGLEAVILHEQASQGMTIIEKIEAHTDVGFAIVLYTADDKGHAKASAEQGQLNARARQNVVFEHGYLIAKLSRARVIPLVEKDVELPSDIKGMVYIDNSNWQKAVTDEMESMGYVLNDNPLGA